jgi:hypothetical protein
MKTVGMMLLLVGLAGLASANVVETPEIDPSSATTALALLSGAVLVLTGRHKK